MRIIISIIIMVVCLNITGQTISQPNNRYRGNDVLEKKQVTVKGFSLSDTKGVWNLEEAVGTEGPGPFVPSTTVPDPVVHD